MAHKPIETAHSLEAALFTTSRIGWASYVFLKYLSLEDETPERAALIKAIWDTLSPEIQAAIRKIRAASK